MVLCGGAQKTSFLFLSKNVVFKLKTDLDLKIPENSGKKSFRCGLNNQVNSAALFEVVSLDWHNDDGSMAAGSSKGKVAHAKLWTKEFIQTVA